MNLVRATSLARRKQTFDIITTIGRRILHQLGFRKSSNFIIRSYLRWVSLRECLRKLEIVERKSNVIIRSCKITTIDKMEKNRIAVFQILHFRLNNRPKIIQPDYLSASAYRPSPAHPKSTNLKKTYFTIDSNNKLSKV